MRGETIMKAILIAIQPKYVADILNGNKTLDGEEWQYVKDTEERYIVSNMGRFASVPRRRTKGGLIKPQPNRQGYLMVAIRKNGKYHLCRLNRLVAETFIENPNNYEQVNHINGNKQDNRTCNLEWCSRSHNQKEAYRLGLQKPSKNQKQVAREYCLNEKSIKIRAIKYPFVKDYNSMSEASRELGIVTSCISRVVRGLRKQARGYRFEVIQ